jgi:glycosyltransferase involved in cell wall biosynthesis
MAADPPLVSVVLTTYNRSELVLPAIDSVLRQTLGDFELIVVDDCSTDDTAEVVGRVDDPRLSLVRHETNLGLAEARNSGISRARGRYLCFLDDDDEWRADKLAVQTAAFDAAPDPAELLVYSQARVDDGVSSDVRPRRGVRPGERLSEYLLCGEGIIAPSSVMISRAAAAGEALFDAGQRRFEDYTLYLRLDQRGFRFQLVDKPLVVWHVDITRPRLSRTVGREEATEWLDSWESRITPRARRAFLAREVAPFLPATGNRWWILRTICTAVVSGSISVKEGLKSLFKALLPPSAIVRLRRLLPRSRFG